MNAKKLFGIGTGLFLFVAILGMTLTAGAQGDTHPVYGVIQLDGVDFEGAEVSIFHADTDATIVDETNDEGEYIIDLINFDWEAGDTIIINVTVLDNTTYHNETLTTTIGDETQQRHDFGLVSDVEDEESLSTTLLLLALLVIVGIVIGAFIYMNKDKPDGVDNSEVYDEDMHEWR